MSRLDGHIGFVNSVAWSPSGEKLASGSDFKTVVVWDAASGAKVAQLEGMLERWRGWRGAQVAVR